MQEVCCGCGKKVTLNERRDILAEDPSIRFYEKPETRRSLEVTRITLSDAIELITATKIDKPSNRFVNLCGDCFERVESYVNFRAKLLASFAKSCPLNAPVDRLVLPADESPLGTTDSEEVINVEEDNVPLDPISSSTDEVDGHESTRESKLRNDQENNNLNDSDASNDSEDIQVSRSILSRIQENDIESEIDVCSGEDDEILELDAQCKTEEPVELTTSSESDLEVCDYEPTGKRMKNYNTLSSSVLFSSDHIC